MLLLITAFVMTSTMAWAAMDRVATSAKRKAGIKPETTKLVGFAAL